MPDLSDLLKGAVEEIPAFDADAMVLRGRHRRQRQLAGGASAAIVLALTLLVWNNASSNNVIVKTRSSTDASTTTAAPTTSTSNEPTSTTSTTTTGAPPPTTPGDTTPTTLPASTDPTAGDFTGTLTSNKETMQAGDAATIQWSITNTSDHEIMPYYLQIFTRQIVTSNTHNLAAVCLKLTPDGQPAARLEDGSPRNSWYPPLFEFMQPGAELRFSSSYQSTPDDVGTVTCEVVIIDLSHGFLDLKVAARVPAIPPVTITVLPAETTTTSTSTSSTTTTTF